MSKYREEEANTVDFNSTVKGIIAVFITILIVVVIVMLFAKSLFVTDSDQTKNIKTGHLTETAFVSAEGTKSPSEEVEAVETTKKKKKTTTEAPEALPDLPEGLDTSVAGEYLVNDAVYLHPDPSSSSANLATLQPGETVTVYGNSNYGWFYLKYGDQYGYAWSSYLTLKT